MSKKLFVLLGLSLTLTACGESSSQEDQNNQSEQVSKESSVEESSSSEESTREQGSDESFESETTNNAEINPEAQVTFADVEDGGTVQTDENGNVSLEGETDPNTLVGVTIDFAGGQMTQRISSDENGVFTYEMDSIPSVQAIDVSFFTDVTIDESDRIAINSDASPQYTLTLENPHEQQATSNITEQTDEEGFVANYPLTFTTEFADYTIDSIEKNAEEATLAISGEITNLSDQSASTNALFFEDFNVAQDGEEALVPLEIIPEEEDIKIEAEETTDFVVEYNLENPEDQVGFIYRPSEVVGNPIGFKVE